MSTENNEAEILAEIASSVEEENNSAATIPIRGESGWSDYVLSQFEDNEVVPVKNDKGIESRYPKVNGLRRLGNLLLGEIIKSYPIPVAVHSGENFATSTFIYHIHFKGQDGIVREFGEVGEVLYFEGENKLNNIGNAQFAKFPSAIAATRAEARALRKALMLNVVAWEEFDKRDLKTKSEDIDTQEFISKEQKNFINVLCKRLKIDLVKYINHGGRKDGKSIYRYDSLDKVTFFDATDMIKQLNSFQNDNKTQLTKYIEQYKLSI